MGDIDALMDAITIVISANASNKGEAWCSNLFSTSRLTCQVTPKWFQPEMCFTRVCVVELRIYCSGWTFPLMWPQKSVYQQYFQLLSRIFRCACWSIYVTSNVRTCMFDRIHLWGHGSVLIWHFSLCFRRLQRFSIKLSDAAATLMKSYIHPTKLNLSSSLN